MRHECFKKERTIMTHMHPQVPDHIAIIMDGNGRWAKKRLLPRFAGHKQGVEAIKRTVRRANERGVKVLTMYAFSTENWNRPEEEVNFIMNLPKIFFKEYMSELIEQNVQLMTIGKIERLPEETQAILNDAIEKTQDNTGMVLNFAINYGGRQEITQAVQKLAEQVEAGTLQTSQITEELVEDSLMTSPLKEYAQPDLLIRTSGEERLSNFLLWQIAYSEFYFSPLLWPDFDGEALDEAIRSYQERDRRFGKV